jgi:4-hydroxythreonine-4-phosphate dehydrogenase
MLPIVISIGDLGGIGPEVSLKGLQAARIKRPIVLYGDQNAIAAAIEQTGLKIKLQKGTPASEAISGVFVRSLTSLKPNDFKAGNPSRKAASSTILHLSAAIDAVKQQQAAAIVTAPIQKEKLTQVGFKHPGHTEFLAAKTGAKRFAMMLAGDRLKVTLVTIHCPLVEVSKRLTAEGVFDKIELTRNAIRDWFGIPDPRIAVTGLNPHAGEGGMFGDEEIRIIKPAIRKALRKGWAVSGPHPADGFFGQLADAEDQVDAVVCMYHDQGLIPLKMVHFWDGVNVTLGLPIIRTSPDHGTAYDIAGKNIADPRSMAQAIRWADQFARREGK